MPNPISSHSPRRARLSPGSGKAAEARRQSPGLSLLFAVSQAVGQTLALDEMLARALDALLSEWDGLFAAAYLTGERGDPFRFLDLALARGPVKLPPKVLETMWKTKDSLRAQVDESLAGAVSYLPELDRKSFEGASSLWDQGVRSLALVPIRKQAAQSGVILLGGRAPFPDDQKTRDLLLTVGTQLGIGLENARMVERQKRQVAHLSALARGGQALARALDRKALLEEIRLQVMEVLSPRNFSLVLTAEHGEGIEVGLSFYNGLRQEKGKFTQAAGLTGYILATRKPLLTEDYERECQRLGIEPAQPWESPSRSWLGVPMLSSGRVLGALVIWDEERPQAFGEEEQEVLSTIASQAAVALENSRLYAQARQKIRDLTALHEIGLEITSTLGVEEILARIVDIVVARLKPFYCGFYRLTEEEPRALVTGPFFRGQNGKPVSAIPDARSVPLDGPGLIAWVAREGRAAFLPDVREDRRYLMGFQEVVSEIAVPLLAKGKVIGVLNAETDRPGAFTEATLEFLNTIAHQASAAIENARLYELLEQSYLDTVRTLVLAMDAKDPYTLGHSERVRGYAVETARLLGMSAEEVQRVSYAGLLHDIGKIGVREDILLKPGKLTPEEFEEVKLHSVMGERLVGNVALLKGVGAMIRSEHENFSGGGYPDGLAGEAIPLGARIIGAADAYDAMTTDRAYRICMTPEDAVSELRRCSGSQFDPQVVEALAQIVCDGKG